MSISQCCKWINKGETSAARFCYMGSIVLMLGVAETLLTMTPIFGSAVLRKSIGARYALPWDKLAQGGASTIIAPLVLAIASGWMSDSDVGAGLGAI